MKLIDYLSVYDIIIFQSKGSVKSSRDEVVVKKPSIDCRTVLWYVSFVGFMVNYMYQININIAIIEMVPARKSPDANHQRSECIITVDEQINSTNIQVKILLFQI